ncbi:MAG: branched-chain amino acid transport system II carrier protein [Firmicutes bacterium]|nr:branched-chain amino acid transport system II carrier protein [Bacillota bacterium]
MNTNRRHMISSTVCMGLALFATQFGAGNLIFPPFLGRGTGSDWMVGFLGFLIMDVGLAAAAVYSVVANRAGTVDGVVGKMGPKAGKVLLTTIILCLGPCVCIPRTACTSYELGLQTMLPGVPLPIYGAVFFAVTLFLVIRPSKVVDIIGKYLTPALLAVMVLLIILGIADPIGKAVPIEDVVAFASGVQNGYQTLDGIGGVLMTMMLMNAAIGYGFRDKKDIKHMVAGADIISAVLLALVYGGLSYLGSTVSGIEAFAGLEQAPLMVAITYALMGKAGVYALATIVILACLTTALGLSAVVGDYFEELTNGKLKYKTVVVTVILLSYAMSNFGLSTIISIAGPILEILYPPLIVLVLGAFFERISSNHHIIKFATYFALISSIICTFNNMFGFGMDFLNMLPFTSLGLGWVCPALIGGVIGSFFKDELHITETVLDAAAEELHELEESMHQHTALN